MKLRAAAVAAAVVVCALAAGAALAATFTDPVGDVVVDPAGATVTGLDVTAVDVTNTPDGLVAFRLTLADNPVLPPNAIIAVVLDLDKNLGTGADGIEAVAGYGNDEGTPVFAFLRYDETADDFVEVPTSALTVGYTDGVLEITVPRNELLKTRGFNFAALTLVVTADGSAAAIDTGPDTGHRGRTTSSGSRPHRHRSSRLPVPSALPHGHGLESASASRAS